MARSTGKLNTFSGVFCQVVLSQFSTGIFLRSGFIVGQAGLLEALGMFAIAYGILLLTLLSICAISTNGAIETGGAYFMTSRVLGPEFGAAIGVLLFCSQLVSCALSVSGFVEFGMQQGILPSFENTDAEWTRYTYQTAVLVGCLLVCLIGAALFARTTLAIFCTVVICYVGVIVSFFIRTAFCVPITPANTRVHSTSPLNTALPVPKLPTTASSYNFTSTSEPYSVSSTSSASMQNSSGTNVPCGNYTGLKLETLGSNVLSGYTIDYTTGSVMSFVHVFSILFSSVTGIMNGANISGELRRPSVSIPRGTLLALGFSAFCYLLLIILLAASCDRFLLLNDYTFLISLNVWQPFVLIGVMCCTLCAALSNMIGGSRILYAIAKDNIFPFLKPCTVTICAPTTKQTSAHHTERRASGEVYADAQNSELSQGTGITGQGQLALMRTESSSMPCQPACDQSAPAASTSTSASASTSTSGFHYDRDVLDVRSQEHSGCGCNAFCSFMCPRNPNPVVAVCTVYVLVQLTSLIGNLNVIAPLCTVAFLLAYASINLTCMTLDLTSAPNFRPTFSYFSWLTALLGLLATLTMCFLVDALYTLVALLFLLFLVLVNYVRGIHSQFESWGSVSQALLFHQVRKYLLKLNVRQHPKYWRPSILLLVANPRSAVRLINFVNCLKKSGLYVLAHVTRSRPRNASGQSEAEEFERVSVVTGAMQRVIELLQVKAFAEVSIHRSETTASDTGPDGAAGATVNQAVLESFANLVLLSGIGGLKPNTVAIGFYDEESPRELLGNFLCRRSNSPPWTTAARLYLRRMFRRNTREDHTTLTESTAETVSVSSADVEYATLTDMLPPIRQVDDDRDRLLNGSTYVALLAQIVAMRKHLVVCRHFDDPTNQMYSSNRYVNVFLTNFFNPRQILAPREPMTVLGEQTRFANNFWCSRDVTCLFLLQMAFVLQMYGGRQSGKRIRVFYVALSRPDRQSVANTDNFRMNVLAAPTSSHSTQNTTAPAQTSSYKSAKSKKRERNLASDSDEDESDSDADVRYNEMLDDTDAIGRELRAVLSGDERQTDELAAVRARIRVLLAELRIRADVRVVALRPSDSFVQLAVPIVVGQTAESQRATNYVDDSPTPQVSYASLTTAYLGGANRLIRDHCDASATCATFLYLPTPPTSANEYETYLQQVNLLTAGLPCTVLLHGAQNVVPDELKSNA